MKTVTDSPFTFDTSLSDAVLATVIAEAFADVARRFNLDRANCPTHPSFTTPDIVRHSRERGTVFGAAMADGQICGCIGVRMPSEGACAIEKLAVLPDRRGLGAGRALVDYAAALAEEAGAQRVEASIIDDHAQLKAWYAKLGFRVVRTVRYERLPFAVCVLERPLERGARHEKARA